jgi:exosortase/archaeosortase family protein
MGVSAGRFPAGVMDAPGWPFPAGVPAGVSSRSPEAVQRHLDLPAQPGPPLRPPGRPRGRHGAGRLRLGIIVRVTAVGILAGLGFTLIVFQSQVRHLEADGAAYLCNLVTPTAAPRDAAVVRFGAGRPGAFSLVITADCSSVLFLAPLCGLGMILIAPDQREMRRVGTALVAVSIVMITANLLRIGIVALVVRMHGVAAGYRASSLLLGSVISVVCVALSLALLTFLLRPRDGGVGAGT